MAGVVLFAVMEPKLSGNTGGDVRNKGPKQCFSPTNLNMQRRRKYTTSNFGSRSQKVR